MRFAIPVHDGRLVEHFGHARAFAFIDVDPKTQEIAKLEFHSAPEHQPGVLPRWIHQMGAQVVIAGGMGPNAQSLLEQNGIEVVIGAPQRAPEDLVKSYLDKTLVTSDNTCDH